MAKPSHYNIKVPLRGGKALVYNSLSGAFALWDQDDITTYERVERQPVEVQSQELQGLIKGGYVVPEDTDELLELEYRYNATRFDPSGMTLTIAPTLACNFGCDYCFQGQDKPGGRMSPAVQEALLAYLQHKLADLRRVHIAWYGGEPLLARQTIYELSDRLIPMGCITAPSWSPTAFPSRARWLKNCWPAASARIR
jgi:uncharacterized protein